MSEEISLLVEKMISKIDALVPYIEDSEEILLASKTLQELINVKGESSDIEAIKDSITQLDKKITDLAIELRAKDSQLVLDLNTANTKISNNEVNILRNEGAIESLESNFNDHIGLYNNPHKTTKTHVGLNNVFNYGATGNPDDSSENKYALAKGVNTVWNKAKNSISDVPADGKSYLRKHNIWVPTTSDVPVGTLLPFYGNDVPDGWLKCARHAVITKDDYPQLFDHLVKNRNTVARQYLYTDESFNTNGFNKGITASSSDFTGEKEKINYKSLMVDSRPYNLQRSIGNYLWRNGSRYVLRVDEVFGIFSDGSVFVEWSVYGTMGLNDVLSDYEGPNVFDAYHSLTDIPLSETEIFLPDMRGNFIRDTGSRYLGAYQVDTLKRHSHLTPEHVVKAHGDASFDYYSGHANVNDGTYSATSKTAETGDYETRPKNINIFWLIKY